MPALKHAQMKDANVRKLDSDETVKDFEAFKLVCFNDPDVIALFDRATTRYEVIRQPSGIAKLKLVRIKERRNLLNWEAPDSWFLVSFISVLSYIYCYM